MSNALEWPRPLRQAILVVLVAAALVAGYFGIRYVADNATILSGQKSMELLPSLSSTMDIRPMGDNILVRDGTTLRMVTPKDVPVWNTNITADMQFSAANDHIAIWNDTMLNVLGSDGKSLFSPKPLQDKIWLARCGYNMTSVLVGEKDYYLQTVNKDGTIVDTRQMPRVTPLDMDYYSRDDLLWYAALEAWSGAPQSSITLIQPSKKQLGMRSVHEQILYKSVFNVNLNEIALVGTHTVTYYDQNLLETKYEEKQVYGWQLIDSHARKDYTVLLFTPTAQAPGAGATFITDVRLLRAAREDEIRLPEGCLAVLCGEKGIYAVAQNIIYTYEYPQAGKAFQKPKAYTCPLPIGKVHAMLAGDQLVLSSGSQVYVLPM